MKRNSQTKQNQAKPVFSIVAGLGTYTDGHKRTRATALEDSEAATQGFSSVQRMPKGKAPGDTWQKTYRANRTRLQQMEKKLGIL